MQIAKRAVLSLIAGAALVAALPAVAQDKFPDRPVMFVVPFPPGGPTDAMARILATELTKELGQSVIVDNKAGAGGNIGAEAVARATPDGYTIMFGTSGPLAINHSLYKGLKYDPRTSFAPVIQVGHLPNILVVRPSLGVNSVQELIAKDKAKPGALNFASSGNGASSHLAGVLFNGMAGTQLVHVPYKGTGPALNDLLAGQVDMTFTDILTAMPYIKSDKVKALGVATAKRSRAMPDIPTIAEQGGKDLKGYDVSVLMLPAGTPPAITKRIGEALVAAIRTPDVRSRLTGQGAEVVTMSPSEVDSFFASERARWAKVVQQEKLQLD